MDANQIVQYDMDPHVSIAIICLCIAMFVLGLLMALIRVDKKR